MKSHSKKTIEWYQKKSIHKKRVNFESRNTTITIN